MSSEPVLKALPEHITVVPPGVSDPLEIYAGSTKLLTDAYLCMLAQGTPDYASVKAATRHWFEYWTGAGCLFDLVLELRNGMLIECAAHGLQAHVTDVVLAPTCMDKVQIGQPITSTRERDELLRAAEHLLAVQQRVMAAEDLLDLAATPPRSQTITSNSPIKPAIAPKSTRKQKIVAEVLELHAQAMPWKEITKQLNAKYGLEYPEATYQRYRRQHNAATDKTGRANAD